MIAGDYLGNAGQVARFRDALWGKRNLFPVLLGKVIYSGTHCGDHLSLHNVAKLRTELDRLKSIQTGDKDLDKELQVLRRKLEKLVHAALRINKPIAF